MSPAATDPIPEGALGQGLPGVPARGRGPSTGEPCTATAPLAPTSRAGAAGYMPEPNLLRVVGDFNPQSGQPLTKHFPVEIALSAVSREDRSVRRKRLVQENHP